MTELGTGIVDVPAWAAAMRRTPSADTVLIELDEATDPVADAARRNIRRPAGPRLTRRRKFITMTDTFTVPAVDISAYVHGGTDAERERTARLIDEACSGVGFIQILGHGLIRPRPFAMGCGTGMG